ncbi:MAG: hypothetical protein KKG91_03710 [Candidatus Omnitrophica bacterium]|nr:hypothetical protein [Candidatus Omnitrophota bacterium]
MFRIATALLICVWFLFITPFCFAQEAYPLAADFFDKLTDLSKEVVGHQISLGEMKATSLDCPQTVYFNWLKQDNIGFSHSLNALEDLLHIEFFHGQKKHYNSTAIKVIKRFIAGLERDIAASIEYSDFSLARLEEESFFREAVEKHNNLLYRINGFLEQVSAELELIPDYEFIEKMEKMIEILPETMGKVDPSLDSDAPENALYWHKGTDGKKRYFSGEEELNRLLSEK